MRRRRLQQLIGVLRFRGKIHNCGRIHYRGELCTCRFYERRGRFGGHNLPIAPEGSVPVTGRRDPLPQSEKFKQS